ncbi:polysaccharide deacetylase family protein [uncultured Sphingomonas sp.]|uniref:polysaccharide deacetylase family protein n=1 Tax=uncultured Sphingomonas sp. TaxID=158754 RepID=UPI0025FC50C0|nr:polysaccharide deacetylase family protein [uncultured Sphingomonas sp.]
MIRILAMAALATGPVSAREIAFTFDDLPAHAALPPGVTRMQVADDIIAALRSAQVPRVYGFINGVQLEREPVSDKVLAAWREAGFPLGNHGWAHLGLSTLDAATFEQEVAKNEPVLRHYMGGKDWHWLRFPFLDEAAADPAKQAAARAYLARKGYRIAGVTASFGDWAFNDPYARCMAKGNTAAVAEMERAYLNAAEASIRLSEQTQMAQFGRTPPDILLMHLGAFDARMLPRLLTLYRQHGFRFVTLEKAAADPANAGLVDPTGPALPVRTMGDAASAALLERVGALCR